MQRALALAVILLTGATAGCFGREQDPGVPAPAERDALLAAMTADDEAHDHLDRRMHEVSYNMELLAHLPLAEPGARSGVQALAVHEDRLFASSSSADQPTLWVFDISNAADPQLIGEWQDEDATGGDRIVDVSEDGHYAFLASEASLQQENVEAIDRAGVHMLDVSDPANILEVSFFPIPSGAHTVEVLTLDGTMYVFALNNGVTILRVADTPLGPQILYAGRWTIATEEMTRMPDGLSAMDQATWQRRALYAHDMRALVDPEAGPLLFVAYAYQGLFALDVAEPATPLPVGRWVPEGEGAPWYTHSVEIEWTRDRRIVAVGTEVFEERHTDTPAPIWVLDMTDLANPQELSEWRNPGGAGAGDLLMSTHWFRLRNGLLHMGHYHGGVWVLDVSTPDKQAAPEVIGAYLPHEDTGFQVDVDCCIGHDLAGSTIVFDVEEKDGVTYAADYQTGLYVLRVMGPHVSA